MLYVSGREPQTFKLHQIQDGFSFSRVDSFLYLNRTALLFWTSKGMLTYAHNGSKMDCEHRSIICLDREVAILYENAYSYG